jgi:uncharacterized protein with GYD domain
MATFITLMNFTDQGIRNVKDSPARYEAFRTVAEKLGVTVKSVYWTVGQYDVVLVMEGSDEAAVTSALLKVGSLGNVRTQTWLFCGRNEANHQQNALTVEKCCGGGTVRAVGIQSPLEEVQRVFVPADVGQIATPWCCCGQRAGYRRAPPEQTLSSE